jgi:hypothetical protein
LEKAKEAGRKERAAVKLREQHGVTETNLDLTYMVLFNLAHQVQISNYTWARGDMIRIREKN